MVIAAERWYPIPMKDDPTANVSAWCWTTQVFQADYYGAQIQFYRRGSGLSQRTLGNLYWQLEDQWAAPTRAGIERSGRWKVLHYRAKDLYQNVIMNPFWNVTTGMLEVWATSDLWSETSGAVDLNWYYWNGSVIDGLTGASGQDVTVGGLNSTRVYQQNLAKQLKKADLDSRGVVSKMNVMLTGSMPNNNTQTTFSHTNWWHASHLSSAKLIDPGLQLSYDNSSMTFTAATRIGVSAWTWLDYSAGAVVYFEDNGFWLGKGESKTVGYNVAARRQVVRGWMK